jgi:DNA-binding MarR family transcriptional regulator
MKASGKKKAPFCDPSELVVHPVLRGYLSYSLYKAALLLRNRVNLALVEHGIVGPQLGILRLLDALGPTSQVEIGRGMGIDKASIVHFIDELEDAGHVARQAHFSDRRVKQVMLTSEGKRFLHKVSKTREAVERGFLSPLSRAEQSQLEQLVAKILR